MWKLLKGREVEPGLGQEAAEQAADASTGLGSCSAQGQYAVCTASGTATKPITITVSVSSSPDQPVSVAWDIVCSQGSGAGSSSGSFTAATPVTRVLHHPYYQPDSCDVAATAQLQNGGNSIHVQLAYSRSHLPDIVGYGGLCVDDSGSSNANGNKVDIYACNASRAQQWKFTSSGELVNAASGKCLNDASHAGSGGKMIQYTCNGKSNETWTRTSTGEYVLKYNHLCLNDPGYSATNGTQLIIWACKNTSNEHWSLP